MLRLNVSVLHVMQNIFNKISKTGQMVLCLEYLNDLKDVSLELIHEVDYAEYGRLQRYVVQNNLNWEKKIRNMHQLRLGLVISIKKDLSVHNILRLCRSAN
ncbi:hypothetical protein RIR_jg19794.t1 [Rhizophagus irregularis DAOM 181602=DAOM 197198]|nr:hypothetical protein RIR_jg19794.t1 [Rhizophagus irregularis DAOM 181602=DAOM 197198]